MQVVLELQEIEARHRRALEVREAAGADDAGLATALPPQVDPGGQAVFGFAEYHEVGFVVDARAGRHVRAADHDRLAGCVGQADEGQGVALLRQHAAGEHHIRPGQIVGCELFGVAVDEAKAPLTRQEGGHGDETERRCRVARADDLAGRPVVPKRAPRKAGDHQQDVGKSARHHATP